VKFDILSRAVIFFNICNTNVQTKLLGFSDFLRIFGEAFNLETESAGGAFKVRLAVVEVVLNNHHFAFAEWAEFIIFAVHIFTSEWIVFDIT
jgi:hypothetical protein